MQTQLYAGRSDESGTTGNGENVSSADNQQGRIKGGFMVFIIEYNWSIAGKHYLVVYDEFRARSVKLAKKRAKRIVAKENKDSLSQGKNHTYEFGKLYKKVLVN